jgi:hypothetical protein
MKRYSRYGDVFCTKIQIPAVEKCPVFYDLGKISGKIMEGC